MFFLFDNKIENLLKKKIFWYPVLILVSCNNNSSSKKELPPVEIKGVVTYFFNNNFGDRPDVGAEVYVINKLKVPDFNLETVDSFVQGTFYRNIYLGYKSMGSKVPDDIMNRLAEYNIKNKKSYDSLYGRAIDYRISLEISPNAIKSIVDGNGNFSLKAPPGSYYILIKSNHQSPSFYCESLFISGEIEKNISHNFDLYHQP